MNYRLNLRTTKSLSSSIYTVDNC